ncbi:MAG: hypothetical protein JSR61_11595 [Proteobacteria bacterium]|nr:hypothetical protein [Pseudomonadota bacterium]
MPKTILLAIATLLLAMAALVTDLVSPYAVDGVRAPAQVQQIQERSPLRVPAKHQLRDIAFISSYPVS